MPKEIIQIAIGQIRVGENSGPSVFALTENGEIYQMDRFDRRREPEWIRLPDIPSEDDDYTIQ